MKGLGGLEDKVPTKSHNDRFPILDESTVNKHLLQHRARTFSGHIGPVLGPDETQLMASQKQPRRRLQRDRIVKRLRLGLGGRVRMSSVSEEDPK